MCSKHLGKNYPVEKPSKAKAKHDPRRGKRRQVSHPIAHLHASRCAVRRQTSCAAQAGCNALANWGHCPRGAGISITALHRLKLNLVMRTEDGHLAARSEEHTSELQ